LTGNLASDLAAKDRVEAFRQMLAELGWTENGIQLEVRWPGPDVSRQEAAARELVEMGLDVIMATSTPTTRALRDTTRTIPIVFVGLSDPVATGHRSAPWRFDAFPGHRTGYSEGESPRCSNGHLVPAQS
jgi:putative ABC transport system substrate-binding protein